MCFPDQQFYLLCSNIQIGHAVVVQTVGGKRRFAVFHAYILPEARLFSIAFVKQKVTIHKKRVA
jgi:hypothetical protein